MIEEKIFTFDRRPVLLGVDEAGRGPVIGPMVYGCAFAPIDTDFKSYGFADSKQLNPDQRDQLFSLIKASEQIGYITHALSAEELSTKMLRKNKYNLNAISHDTCAGLIRRALERGVVVTEVYIDTVGDPEKYQQKLQYIFPGIKVTVAKKADSLYPIVSAASICAKVTRDLLVQAIPADDVPVGSGYPADERSVKYLESIFHPVLGFNDYVRYSWSTVDEMIKTKGGVDFVWHEENDQENIKGAQAMTNFLNGKRKIYARKHMKLAAVPTDLI
jgi:ribonuclease H2 subunit A